MEPSFRHTPMIQTTAFSGSDQSQTLGASRCGFLTSCVTERSIVLGGYRYVHSASRSSMESLRETGQETLPLSGSVLSSTGPQGTVKF